MKQYSFEDSVLHEHHQLDIQVLVSPLNAGALSVKSTNIKCKMIDYYIVITDVIDFLSCHFLQSLDTAP
jgi:hypothetical protein